MLYKFLKFLEVFINLFKLYLFRIGGVIYLYLKGVFEI